MGACGSKRAPNVEERSERLHEFFGATIDCEVRPSGLGSAEAVAQDEPQLSPEGVAPSSEALASAMAPVARPPPRWPPATEFQA